MPTLKLTKVPEREVRYGYLHGAAIEPGAARHDAAHDADATHEINDSEFRFDTKKLIDALEDDKQPFSCERFLAQIEAEKELAAAQKRVEELREFLKQPVKAGQLDGGYVHYEYREGWK
jgi:hypothetical protein